MAILEVLEFFDPSGEPLYQQNTIYSKFKEHNQNLKEIFKGKGFIENGILTSKDIRNEVSTDLKFTRDKLINKFKLVSREEFDILKKIVQKQDLIIKKLSKKKKAK